MPKQEADLLCPLELESSGRSHPAPRTEIVA